MQRLKAFIWVIVLCLVIMGILFVSAGRTDLPMFWAYVALTVVPIWITFAAVYQQVPEMMEEQKRVGEGNRDKITGQAYVLFGVCHWVIAGLDAGRYHWSTNVSSALQIIGLIVSGCGVGLLAWSIITNHFYSPRVSIQTERGQEIVSIGPYHFVRHPGYVGWILFMLFSGITLGSWLSIVPTLVLVVLIIRRTIIEDEMLQHDLKGYKDYTLQVRYRLIPGLW